MRLMRLMLRIAACRCAEATVMMMHDAWCMMLHGDHGDGDDDDNNNNYADDDHDVDPRLRQHTTSLSNPPPQEHATNRFSVASSHHTEDHMSAGDAFASVLAEAPEAGGMQQPLLARAKTVRDTRTM